VLEVRASGAADEHGIASKYSVGQHETVGIAGVSRRVQDFQTDAVDVDGVAVVDAHGNLIDLSGASHHRNTVGAVTQGAERRDVVGMDVCVDRFDQLQVHFVEELHVAIHLLKDGIYDQRFAADLVRQQVGVGG
jgi:hypothetical protein